jgi:cell division FtsZ-interacting protein ZapD
VSTPAFDQLRSLVMILPESERAELAHDLIKSLDKQNDDSISSAYDIKIKGL